jgi:hypothetical protein
VKSGFCFAPAMILKADADLHPGTAFPIDASFTIPLDSLLSA